MDNTGPVHDLIGDGKGSQVNCPCAKIGHTGQKGYKGVKELNDGNCKLAGSSTSFCIFLRLGNCHIANG